MWLPITDGITVRLSCTAVATWSLNYYETTDNWTCNVWSIRGVISAFPVNVSSWYMYALVRCDEVGVRNV